MSWIWIEDFVVLKINSWSGSTYSFGRLQQERTGGPENIQFHQFYDSEVISAVTLVELIRRERQKSLKEGRSSEKKAKSLVPNARDPLRWNLWRGILIEQRPRSSNINSDPFSENGTGNGTSKFTTHKCTDEKATKRIERNIKVRACPQIDGDNQNYHERY